MSIRLRAPMYQAIASGVSVSGATLTFSGEIYADPECITPLANPLTADAAGRFVAIYIPQGATYTATLKRPTGQTLNSFASLTGPFFAPAVGLTARDERGAVIPFATLDLYWSQITVPRVAYSDEALENSIGSTLTADASGVFPDAWLPDSRYRYVLKDAQGELIYDVSGLEGEGSEPPVGGWWNILRSEDGENFSMHQHLPSFAGGACLSVDGDEYLLCTNGPGTVTRYASTDGANYGPSLNIGSPPQGNPHGIRPYAVLDGMYYAAPGNNSPDWYVDHQATLGNSWIRVTNDAFAGFPIHNDDVLLFMESSLTSLTTALSGAGHYSEDGEDYTKFYSPVFDSALIVGSQKRRYAPQDGLWDGGNFVVICSQLVNDSFPVDDYNGRIVYSPDGKEWTVAQDIPGQSLVGIAYGNGIHVCVSWDGREGTPPLPGGNIYYSTDGALTWAQAVTAPDAQYRDVAYQDGVFVALPAGDHEGLVDLHPLYSYDGETWADGTVPAWITESGRNVVAGNGLFMFFAVKQSPSGSVVMMLSNDGETWTEQAVPSPLSSAWVLAGFFSFVDGYFYATFYAGGTTNYAFRSTDCLTWVSIASIVAPYLAKFKGLYCALRVYSPASPNNINPYYSPDLVTWTEVEDYVTTNGDFGPLVSGGSRIIAPRAINPYQPVGAGATRRNIAAYSTDGTNFWPATPLLPVDAARKLMIKHVNDLLVTVGVWAAGSYRTYTSPDGEHYTEGPIIPGIKAMLWVDYSLGEYYAIAENETGPKYCLMVSDDARAWVKVNTWFEVEGFIPTALCHFGNRLYVCTHKTLSLDPKKMQFKVFRSGDWQEKWSWESWEDFGPIMYSSASIDGNEVVFAGTYGPIT